MIRGTSTDLLRNFVRGEHESDVFTTFGVVIVVDDDTMRLEEPADGPVYEASATDVAMGLLSNWAVGTALQQWARVLLATCLVDLASLEDHPHGEDLLNALWDAAGATPLTEDQLQIARVVASRA